MSDWIDQLKERHEYEEKHEHARELLKLRKHELIKSKLPDFLNAASDEARGFVERLRCAFPKKVRYHLDFGDRYTLGFSITNPHLMPNEKITLKMGGAGTSFSLRKDGRHGGVEEIRADLDEDDTLVVSLGDKRYSQPTVLAEDLVRLVADINE